MAWCEDNSIPVLFVPIGFNSEAIRFSRAECRVYFDQDTPIEENDYILIRESDYAMVRLRF